ncbi:JAB domain-containing protein [Chryseobacterium indologenes]|uniref:JAB domain-containing protein n=1 Tax=Chryseobacterium indologenes TaxID=253 RepID=A0AAD0YXF8_CHRID|nr:MULTISPECIES: DNA repair protein RadC [Chryseobacterium]ASE60939.1 JAB domain-containing protein [Chryseobacterium indologenes]AYY86199.1 JAB domain-containing protein [Chryseobacterium indologenes]AYZ35971.1 JAB domain-containing protein [Chryseobacterium indologenes]AZB16629.1 JAB domain-containing protein [Chryseobacterium indologenes]MBF6644756.1 DNA repair protein RadC [Chryseobacterium indologenes]
MPIKFLAEDDRPREKFLQKGKNSLSDSELLAIIMGSGNKEESSVELARRILTSVNNNWHQLSLLSVKDLMKFKGIGEAKAISIASALEIGRRRAGQEIPEKSIIGNSHDAYAILKNQLSDLRTEEFWAIFLNNSNKVIHIAQLTHGGISQAIVDVRILFKIALEHFSTGVIIAHNHPSGSVKPSREDLNITQKIKEAGQTLTIQLLDHIIITQDSYFSFSDSGLL